MATLDYIAGAETGGLDELTSSVGSPTADATVKRTGEYSYKLTGTVVTEQSISLLGSNGTADPLVGFGFRWNVNLIPTSNIDILAVETTLAALIIRLRIKAVTGNLVIVDAANVEQATVAAPFAQNTWYYVELRHFENATTGTATLWIDGVQQASLSNQNFSTAGIKYTFKGSLIVGEDIWIDDYYALGAAVDGDRYGSSQVFAYQSGNTGTASDAGLTVNSSTLAAGTWNGAGKTPLETAVTSPKYTANPADGAVLYDDAASGGRGPGPSGGAYTVTGTIRGAKWVWSMFRGAGAGSTHSGYFGNGADTPLGAQPFTLTTSAAIYERVSVAAVQVPLSTEVFAQGFGVSGAQDITVDEMWAMLLHTPPAPSADLPPGLGPAVSMQQPHQHPSVLMRY